MHLERFQLDLPTKIQGFGLSTLFFPGLFPFPSLSAAFGTLRPACAALSPHNSPGYSCQWSQIFIPFQFSPQHGLIGNVFWNAEVSDLSCYLMLNGNADVKMILR